MNESSEFQYSMCNLCTSTITCTVMAFFILYIILRYGIWCRDEEILLKWFSFNINFSLFISALHVCIVYCVYVAVREICNFNLSRLLSFLLTSNNRCQLHQNEERYCSDGTSLSSAFSFISYSSIITMSIYYLILFLSTNFRLYTILFKFVFIYIAQNTKCI